VIIPCPAILSERGEAKRPMTFSGLASLSPG
jgi:hypothetical protein